MCEFIIFLYNFTFFWESAKKNKKIEFLQVPIIRIVSFIWIRNRFSQSKNSFILDL
jgi:hypothetical protein